MSYDVEPGSADAQTMSDEPSTDPSIDVSAGASGESPEISQGEETPS